VRIIPNIDTGFWWEVARSCGYTTFFHTPLWHQLATLAYPGYRDRSVGFVLPSGVSAVLPLLETSRVGPLRRLISTFESCYGGLIADGPLSYADEAAIYRVVLGWRALDYRVLSNPFAPSHAPLPGASLVSDATLVVDLDADFERVFARFSKGQRNSYRRGCKAGVQIRPATSLDDYRAYYRAYRDTVNRWGKPDTYGHPWELFASCYELSRRHPEQIALWTIVVDEKVVGGNLVFYWGQHSVVWHGALDRAYLSSGAMPVADTEVIRDAIARGFRYYDFNPSAGIAGIIAYKRGFGARERPVTHIRYEHPWLRQALSAYRRARYGSAEWSLSAERGDGHTSQSAAQVKEGG
jgi:CelD/BcsL family acetyltransferase involved in cellulose biosynthesis